MYPDNAENPIRSGHSGHSGNSGHNISRDIFGLLFLLLALLLLASLVSFNPELPRSNWIGLAGGMVSQGLFFCFGKASFLVVLFLAILSLNFFRPQTAMRSAIPVIGSLLLLAVGSVFLGLIKPDSAGESGLWLYGGWIGSSICGLGLPLTGRTGLFLISIFLILACLVMTFRISFSALFGYFREASMKSAEKKKARLAGRGAVDDDDLPPLDGRNGPVRGGRPPDDDDDLPPPPPGRNRKMTAGRQTAPEMDAADRLQKPPLIEKVEYILEDLDAGFADGPSLPERSVVVVDDPDSADPTEDGAPAGRSFLNLKNRKIGKNPKSPKNPNNLKNLKEPDSEEKAKDSGKKAGKRFPPLTLLGRTEKMDAGRFAKDIRRTSEQLEEVLRDFGIESKVINTEIGPVITRYELKVASGVRLSRIVGLSDNIALSLAAQSVRIVAPIPGKAAVGIEIPNPERHLVTLGDLLARAGLKDRALLDFALGFDVSGRPVVLNLRGAPHLLIAGATGQGKSVCLNSIICSFLYNCPSDEVKMILVDPKMVELKVYNGIEHLLTEVITNPKKASLALRWLVNEMERRYQMMDQLNARDIDRYNQKLGKDPEAGRKMPYIVLIVDELADLMMVAAKDIEESIARLAQKARAVGIHLILATQRPSVDVITGVIKANFPSRIAFQVASKIDSRTILDQNGADQLLGKGDLLLSFAGSSELVRIQGSYVSDEEVGSVVEHLKDGAKPEYNFDIVTEEDRGEFEFDGQDGVYQQAVEIVRATKKASASYLQRKLQIGYNRAARYIDMMEQEGLVGPQNGSKPREVYLS